MQLCSFLFYFCEMENKIKALTALNKINLQDLAEQSGLEYASVARWSRNVNQPKLCDAVKLCKVLKCTLNDLVLQTEDKLNLEPQNTENDNSW